MRWKERGQVRPKAWLTAVWVVPVLASCNSILGIESDYHLANGGRSAGGSGGSGAGAGKSPSAGKGGTGASGGTSSGGTSSGAAGRGGGATGGTGQGGGTGGTGDTSGTAGASGAGDAGDGSGGTGGSQGGSGQGGSAQAGGGAGGTGAAGKGTAGTGTAGNGAAGSGAAGMSAIVFNDHFTDDTVGSVPVNWGTFVNGTSNSSTQMLVRVDDTHHHVGAPSVHVSGPDADSNVAQLTRPVPRWTPTIYVAFWMYASRFIGGQTDTGYRDATLVALRKAPGDTSSELRFGEMNGALGVHAMPANTIDVEGGADAYFQGGLPYYWPNTWECVQVAFVAGTSSSDPDKVMFAAGALPYTLIPTDIGASWDSWVTPIVGAPGPEIAIGWESSNGGLAAADLWIDDVVISDHWIDDCPGSLP